MYNSNQQIDIKDETKAKTAKHDRNNKLHLSYTYN